MTTVFGRAVPTWLRLIRIYQKGDRHLISHLREHDVSLAQFDVLAQISGHSGLSQQDLADRLLVTKGNVCQLVERMSDAGLISRRPDGRANRLHLTAHGQEVLDHLLPAQNEEIDRIFSVLTPEELAQLNGLLRKVERSLT